MKTYTLTQWSVVNHPSLFGAFVLQGLIQGNPAYADGTLVRTSAVVQLDNETQTATTHHSGAYLITAETVDLAWAPSVEDISRTFLTDACEVAPFDGEQSSDGQDDIQDGPGDDGDADANLVDGLPPALAKMLAELGASINGPDDALAGDEAIMDDGSVPAPVPTAKRSHKARA